MTSRESILIDGPLDQKLQQRHLLIAVDQQHLLLSDLEALRMALQGVDGAAGPKLLAARASHTQNEVRGYGQLLANSGLDVDVRDQASHPRFRVHGLDRSALEPLDPLHQSLPVIVDD